MLRSKKAKPRYVGCGSESSMIPYEIAWCDKGENSTSRRPTRDAAPDHPQSIPTSGHVYVRPHTRHCGHAPQVQISRVNQTMGGCVA